MNIVGTEVLTETTDSTSSQFSPLMRKSIIALAHFCGKIAEKYYGLDLTTPLPPNNLSWYQLVERDMAPGGKYDRLVIGYK